ncbi:MAG TPA: class D sortase [Terriglobales bacterium]|nr:class D sortase [Terriglobales bacterium]
MALWVFVAGVALLVGSLMQYGFMALRQHQLRQQQWSVLNRPEGAGAPSRDAGLRLIIPSIQLDDAVVHGTTYEDLLVAPGLLEGAPLPGGNGNTVIAGHRDTFFRHVSDLHTGAEIVLRSGGRTYDYRVTSRRIVKPTETSVLDSNGHAEVTLVTCYPTYWIGPAPDRLIVQAVAATPPGF